MFDDDIEAPELEQDQVTETPDREPIEKADKEGPKSIRDSLKDAIKIHTKDTDEKPVDRPKRERQKPAALNGAADPAIKDSKPEGQVAQTPANAPNGFSEEAKAEWARTPPSVQQAITKRIADLDVGVKQVQQRYGGIHQTVQRLNPIFQKYGQTPDQGMAIQAAWAEAIEQNPAAAIQALASQYKVDLSKLSQGSVTQPQQQQYAQSAKPGWATEIENRLESMQQSKTEEAFNAWKSNKPHAEALRETMATILAGAAATQNPVILDATGTKIDLDKVYEMASWQHPEIRAKIIKEQKDAEAKARAEDVKKAKRAGVSARPSTPGTAAQKGTGHKKGMSVRESLNAVIEDLRS